MLNNLSNIIQILEGKEDAAEQVNKIAIARILKAWSVSILTDTYGDVLIPSRVYPRLRLYTVQNMTLRKVFMRICSKS